MAEGREHPLLRAEVGRRELWLGNEAVVRGALEAGVGLVTGYPGTPASEIGDCFRALQQQLGLHCEYSVNEKIALEVAYGASLTGVRALTSMKHLGLTSAADPLSTMPYIGVVGGLVIVSAADPGCLTSPNEQDQRHLGRMLGLPTLDPATPDEARRMTAWAFELSEACELPVLLRITTRVCHTRAAVELGPLPVRRPAGVFNKNPGRFLPTPVNARRLREQLQRRLDNACELLTASPFNRVTLAARAARRGVIAAGAPRNVVRHVLAGLEPAVPLLELGALHPLPHEVIVPFLRGLDEALVVEELTPYLEDSLLAIAQHHGVRTRLHGKRDGKMPWPFELEPEEVERRIRDFLGLEPAAETRSAVPGLAVPPRPPVLCPGCLHRNVFHAASAVFGARAVCVNDIGCYTLGANAPYFAGDVLLAMGSSIPLAAGIARSTGQRVVAFIGDSTFFHSGMPALLNAIEQQDDVVVVVLDNHITAMTGLQPNASSGTLGKARRRIGEVARALGVENVSVVDAAQVPELIRVFGQAREAKGLAVVVAEGPCALNAQKSVVQRPAVARIDAAKCHTCGMSEAGLHCGLAGSVGSQRQLAVQRAARPLSSHALEPAPIAEAAVARRPSRSTAAAEISAPREPALRPLSAPAGRASATLQPAANEAAAAIATEGDAGLPRSSTVVDTSARPSAPPVVQRPAELSTISPCSVECPLGICVPAYVGAIAAGEPDRALAAVVLRAALPSVCSHLCHRPCEDVCVRATEDRPVGVNALKRHLFERHVSPPPHRAQVLDGFPIAIIGAGPAGLAAARELAHRGHAPTLFDARERPGGMLEYAVPEFRLPRQVLRRDIQTVLDAGVAFEGNQRLGRDFTLDSLRTRGFRAILLALGTQRSTRPALPGTNLPGVLDALSFLEQRPQLTGEQVLVLGGGDIAIDAARTALRQGARSVALVFPEPEDEMAAASDCVQLARDEGVAFNPGHAILSITDAAGLKVQLGRVSGCRREGRAVTWDRLEQAEVLSATRVVIATGLAAELAGLGLPPALGTSEGWLSADAFGGTAVADLFVAGDVCTGPSTVTAAMAAGVRAAFAIDEALSPPGRAVPGPAAPMPKKRVSHRRVARPLALQESSPPLTEAEARAEANRCLLCGLCANCNTCVEVLACPAITRDAAGDIPHVLAELCTGCSACVQACPNQAIGGCA